MSIKINPNDIYMVTVESAKLIPVFNCTGPFVNPTKVKGDTLLIWQQNKISFTIKEKIHDELYSIKEDNKKQEINVSKKNTESKISDQVIAEVFNKPETVSNVIKKEESSVVIPSPNVEYTEPFKEEIEGVKLEPKPFEEANTGDIKRDELINQLKMLKTKTIMTKTIEDLKALAESVGLHKLEENGLVNMKRQIISFIDDLISKLD